MQSQLTATAAALTLTAVACFSKVYVYGAYALALYRKKAHFLKLYQEESLDEVVEQMLQHLGFVVAAHIQFLFFASLNNVDSNEDGSSLEPAVLVFYLNLLLGAVFAVRFAFGILLGGEMRIPWRHEIMGNDDPLSCFVKNTPKSSRRGHDGIPQYAVAPY